MDPNDPDQQGHGSRATQARRVLVTGGAGFIGSHLCELLAGSGAQIVVVDNLTTGRETNLDALGSSVSLINARLSDALAGELRDEAPFDHIYHLAAAVGVDLVLQDPVGTVRSNIIETDALLEYATEHGKPPTLIASSSEVYGKPGASVFSEEDDVLYGPTSITRWSYAYTKGIDEYLAVAYARSRGLPTVVTRFFNTVGPRQVGRYGMVLPRFVASALKNEPLRVFGDGKQTRCFCDVRDVVRALPALLESTGAHGRVFNTGSDTPIEIGTLAQRVIDVLGSGSSLELVEYDDAYPDGFEDLRHRKPDLTRLREAIGFEPRISLDETIRDIAEQIRASSDNAAAAGGAR